MKTIDYAKALSWYVNDKKFWPTVLTISLYLLSCLLIFPIFYVAPVLTGYSIALIRSIQAGKYELLELNNSYWKDGVTLVAAAIALSMVFGMVFGIVAVAGYAMSSILREVSDTLGALASVGVNLFGFLIQAVCSFVVPIFYFVAYAIYAKTGTLNSLFVVDNYKKIWANNEWNLVISYAIYMAATSALVTIGIFACCVGVLPATVIAMLIMAGFAGQLEIKGIV